MRTDVKVGLVCVLILVIAVVAYFALEGKGTPAPVNEHAKPRSITWGQALGHQRADNPGEYITTSTGGQG